MHSSSPSGSTSQYGEAVHVPLIKSPSLRVPKLVQVPPDIHPLPDSVTAYFVYPYTLEEHIITLENKRRSTLATNDAQRLAVLQRHEHKKEQQRLELERIKRLQQEEQERIRKEQLRKVAPGFDPSVGALVPKKVGAAASTDASTSSLMLPPPPPPAAPQRDVMADLVDQLAALDAAHS
ncbi:SubName: Full=Uncharacterized protein {ECO:0000313/EMBL:CCA75420.1} [Serendipita indica DSM 11827]|uniref:Uncharacterized protein n=1 Tax=Serendipita indica (strain DSM 11827) TaxID=1109443 RepID=G4TVS7_SERID|nr:SubName: Full=Uncharacterized protein {ECO:0000313/EMBL:CCA75420.1} [Serendipita indica DSM 11827]CCA75420.1 hypothetical protein PIIN_09403 [Serendipita indica DSM 11827]